MFLPSQQQSAGKRYLVARTGLFLAGAVAFLLGASMNSRLLVWIAIGLFLAAFVLRFLARRRVEGEAGTDGL